MRSRSRGAREVESTLDSPRVAALIEVQHAHEPVMGKILDRHPAERVFVELGELDDPEARLSGVEQPRERPLGLVATR